MTTPILEVEQLSKFFTVRTGWLGDKQTVHAVDDVSFSLQPGECFGLVGESGCGKSTLSRTLLQLYRPTAGTVRFEGQDLFSMGKREARENSKHIQMVFQDPFWSINPKMKIGAIVEEPLVTHTKLSKAEREAKVRELLEQVGLPADFAKRFPHQLSGGQRQRVGIARAIALDPRMVILDEPTSALDMSVQAQILNLLKDLQEQKKLTYLLVSHDLSVIKHMCTRMAVMYLGQIVEMGDAASIFNNPLHPYTQLLLQSLPSIDETEFALSFFEGEMPKAVNPPAGCRFATRCPHKMDTCQTTPQQLLEVKPGHWVRCQVACG
ncbi:ATP-binding cassette domain-containing protein [Brevibacillus fluminis]|uniref:ATP-binding cassette domain-containing protein n=1 Tax=Brevibacillus fluminis TaxID=511487 RepID=A0A3M8CWA0_9BACL|nr:oligopeptide/dipeptide ABC transporter ATP-binding protein [Brevibacillus fluminis]RNB80034.1 ATP-binding cassette domain-containing protein [Brevibacillus fluminis]